MVKCPTGKLLKVDECRNDSRLCFPKTLTYVTEEHAVVVAAAPHVICPLGEWKTQTQATHVT